MTVTRTYKRTDQRKLTQLSLELTKVLANWSSRNNCVVSIAINTHDGEPSLKITVTDSEDLKKLIKSNAQTIYN